MKVADDEVIKLLMKADIQRNTARTILFLYHTKEATSKEIENATKLKQPEVSVALSDLKKRNLVSVKEVKKEGKGRPVNAYGLTKPLVEIIEEIKKEKIDEFERVKKLL